MTRRRLGLYLQVGRVHGAGLTLSCALVGVLTGADPDLRPGRLFLAALVGLLVHLGGAAANEVAGIEEDGRVPDLKQKPLVKGDLDARDAILASFLALGTAVLLSMLTAGPVPTLVLAAGIGLAVYYNFRGKYRPWSYEFSLGLGMSLGLLYGSLLGGGATSLSAVAAGVVFCAVSFAQWAGGLKDVVSDREAGVPTSAVRWGYQPGASLGPADPNWRLALSMKSAALLIYSLPALGRLLGSQDPFQVSPAYGWIFLLVVLPSQLGIILGLLRPMDRRGWYGLIVLDLGVSWIMAPLLVLVRVGVVGAVLVALLPLAWLTASSLLVQGGLRLPEL